MKRSAAHGTAAPLNEAVREAEILRSGALFVGEDPRLTALVERARSLFDTDMAALTIIHGQWQHIIAAVGTVTGTFPRSASFCTYTIRDSARVFCVPDARADPELRESANVVGGARIRFYAGAPIVSAGQPLGALCVFDSDARPCLDAEEEKALQALAALAMTTIASVARSEPSN